MTEYQNILVGQMRSLLIMIPLLLIGLYLLYPCVASIRKKRRKGKVWADYLATAILFIISVFTIATFVHEAGVPCYNLYMDYKYTDYRSFEGSIQDISSSNCITKQNVVIDKTSFMLPDETLEVMSQHTGDYCKIVYGTRSNLVLDYEIVS